MVINAALASASLKELGFFAMADDDGASRTVEGSCRLSEAPNTVGNYRARPTTSASSNSSATA
jgi:hypothetical protein